MEYLRSDAESLWLSSYFVEGQETVISVKHGVFDSLGRHGTRRLLKFHDKAFVLVGFIRLRTMLLQKETSYKVEYLAADGRISPLGLSHRPMDEGFVSLTDRLRPHGHIRPIHRETSNDFSNGIGQTIQREVSRSSISLGKNIELMAEHINLARHGGPHDKLFCLVDHIGIGLGTLGYTPIEITEGPLPRMVYE